MSSGMWRDAVWYIIDGVSEESTAFKSFSSPENGGSMFLRNIVTYLPNYISSQDHTIDTDVRDNIKFCE